jgi:hypothetical protein
MKWAKKYEFKFLSLSSLFHSVVHLCIIPYINNSNIY